MLYKLRCSYVRFLVTNVSSRKIGLPNMTTVGDLQRIFKAGIAAVLPQNLVKIAVKYNPKTQLLTINAHQFDLHNKNVYVVGAGKAVQYMAMEVENILGSKINQGIISIPEGSLVNQNSSNNIKYYEGAKNNLPDQNAEATARLIEELALSLMKEDFLIVLLSGGGSALLPLTKKPISLDEKLNLIKSLSNSGADIQELNNVRKYISAIKGGKLALKAQPAQVVSLIISDIVGDPLDLIASGPTIPNEVDNNQAISIIKKYNLYSDISSSIRGVLEKNQNHKINVENSVNNFLIGSNTLSIAETKQQAHQLNYDSLELTNLITGNVTDVAELYVKLSKIIADFIKGQMNIETMKLQIGSLHIKGVDNKVFDQLAYTRNKNICLVLGGETTVEVKGTGKGGRNQQLALQFAYNIHKVKDCFDNLDVYFLSAGTDGIDGPTNAAGAIAYLDLIKDAQKEGLDVQKYLDNNDSYHFFDKFRNGLFHVITGHTHTNVMDLHLIVIKYKLFTASFHC